MTSFFSAAIKTKKNIYVHGYMFLKQGTVMTVFLPDYFNIKRHYTKATCLKKFPRSIYVCQKIRTQPSQSLFVHLARQNICTYLVIIMLVIISHRVCQNFSSNTCSLFYWKKEEKTKERKQSRRQSTNAIFLYLIKFLYTWKQVPAEVP